MKITVLGAGTMGKQIALLFAQHQIHTVLYDNQASTLTRIKEEQQDCLHLQVENNLIAAVREADLIIESVFEDVAVKLALYEEVLPHVQAHALLASNTSSLGYHALSVNPAIEQRLFFMHFFNPADVIPLVEIYAPTHIPSAALKEVLQLLEHCGKVPVRLKKDVPGFIANRLQVAILREALALLQSEVAEAADIDAAMKYGLGIRWACAGPFEISDFGGLDIWKNVFNQLAPKLAVDQNGASLLAAKVARGELGLKSGSGFYQYPFPEESLATYRARLASLARLKI